MMSVITKSVRKLFIFPPAHIRNISRNVQEVRIPTTAGCIAGKWWGPKDRRPIVALHGWQDNCGTFDRLIPLLPEHIPILALDLVGHGYSFKLPAGIPYRDTNVLIMLKELISCFGWNKITLMGHSLGAVFSYTYGFLFPKDVDYLICIDGLQPLINAKKLERVAVSIEEFLKYDAQEQCKEEPPSYTIEELARILHLATRKSIAVDCAKYILQRNIAPSKKYAGKFYFTRDVRLKGGPLECPDPVEIFKMASNVRFPIFITKAEARMFFGSEIIFNKLQPILKEASRDYQMHWVPGTHHVHLNEPENVAHLINEFIKKHDVDDRNNGGLKPEIVFNENFDNSHKHIAAQF